MRGRVSAVNMLFIGASNELGEFESGVTAAWWGTVPAVIVGGVGTLGVVVLWAWMFPELRKIDRLSDLKPDLIITYSAATPEVRRWRSSKMLAWLSLARW
jgi:hypothetical protein